MILSERLKQHDSGIDDGDGEVEEGAVEIAEDLAELQDEGVNIKLKKTGKVVKQVASALRFMRQKTPAMSQKSDAGVRVSICARCAKVMGGEPSESAMGSKYGELPDYDTERPKSEAQSAVHVSPGPSDDEFESVSQVTGPRRPVWQEDSVAITPQKDAHMFTAPTKGGPMFSPDAPDTAANRNKKASKMATTLPAAKSEDFAQSKSVGFAGHSEFAKTWTVEPVGMTDSEPAKDAEKMATDADVKKDDDVSESGFGQSSFGWQVPDYDTDASDVTSRKYSGQF